MDKLQLHEIAGYLPYGLKMLGCQSLMSGNILHDWTNDEWEITPILHPLSDLTKEIEVDGEKFVPIRKLASIEGLIDDSDANPDIIYDGISAGIRFCIENDETDDTHEVFAFTDGIGFGRHYRPRKEYSIVGNQKELWESLYRWHFDIHNLINRGLAIDINSIESEVSNA